jgi:hypothetical protein
MDRRQELSQHLEPYIPWFEQRSGQLPSLAKSINVHEKEKTHSEDVSTYSEDTFLSVPRGERGLMEHSALTKGHIGMMVVEETREIKTLSLSRKEVWKIRYPSDGTLLLSSGCDKGGINCDKDSFRLKVMFQPLVPASGPPSSSRPISTGQFLAHAHNLFLGLSSHSGTEEDTHLFLLPTM